MNAAETRAHAAREVDGSYSWTLVALLWVAAFVNSAGRCVPVAVMPQLREQFGLSLTQLALVNSAFFWVYAPAAFVAARLGERARRSRVIVGGLLLWSVATGLVSLATGFASLVALRAMVALTEANYYPASTALISDWHGGGTRSWALSIHQTAVFAGAAIGALGAGLVADQLGWNTPFLVLASLGLFYCIFLRRRLRDAPVRSLGAGHAAETVVREPIRTVLRRRPALYLCAVFFLATGASAGVWVWAPTFVHDAHRVGLATAALYGTAMPALAGLLFVPFGGFLADLLARRTPLGRFYTLAIGLALAGALLLPLAATSSALGVGLVLLASAAGKALFDGSIYAAMHDVVPPEARATAVGLMTMAGFCGAGLTPIFVAEASKLLGTVGGMASLALLYFAAVALVMAIRSAARRTILETRLDEEVGTP